ncbi:pyridoxal phosphate-dependent enzyme [Shewanella sediminis HAW-EB3]|uniref:Pyridoxal phosphate-dependent enzyme n=1 Tax=Shewanella sediminis (strain HAW-EB3) TaxID=425104 RepID=A8FXN4_SHESH|nr:DegT/DnrJ/EryC1/StrS family aminotransferase [Shewanella sediminis]ABV37607.1 pyridoxal phosphate-dependent enzyme [Shewanella sediminis HAW-EB3]
MDYQNKLNVNLFSNQDKPSYPIDEFLSSQQLEPENIVSFAERKEFNINRVSELLESSEFYNRWSNRGPAWFALAHAYENFFTRLTNKVVIPCANGGIALEALAGLHNVRQKKTLRWCVSSFSFANAGRGVFSNAIKVDCDEQGALSLDALSQIDQNSFDGIVVTNPFGLLKDFSLYSEWQNKTGKVVIYDNAAGINADLPDVPYQSLSLHHTKPFGLGEGGLIIVPKDEFEDILKLIEYTTISPDESANWVNNGKISDISCAALLTRLETSAQWIPLYQQQAIRLVNIAEELGYSNLFCTDIPAMGYPLLAPYSIESHTLENSFFRVGKYYKPLAKTSNATSIFNRIINVPSHPDMHKVSDDNIRSVLQKILDKNLLT